METMAQAGIIVTVLVWAVFSAAWILDAKKRIHRSLTAGIWIDAFGFAALPAISVWKIFEPYTILNAAGKAAGTASASGILLSGEGRLIPWRIELFAALIAFAAVTIWLILRKRDLDGNGDMALTVLCIWGAVRSVTEGMRETPLSIGTIHPVTCAAVSAGITVLAVWSVRRGRKQKSAGLTALEWAAVIVCNAVILIIDAGIVTPGTVIVNIAVSAGCAVLSAVMILFAGKDSREA